MNIEGEHIMTRVFIFANSFTAKTIALSINEILNKHIDEVILLSENHEEYEFNELMKDINIRFFDNIEQSVFASDIVLICITPNIPLNKISYVKSVARKMDKHLIVIECAWNNSLKNEISSYFNNIDLSSCIIILNISLSQESQQFYGELLLNRILSRTNISFKQFFSQTTMDILQQLNEKQVLNQNLVQQICRASDHFDVAILSITLGEFKNALRYFNAFSPDYVVVQSDFRGDSIAEIISLLKSQFNVSSDFIIKSHYIQLANAIPFQIYCNQKEESTNTYDLETNELPSMLEFDLLSKIALPYGIKRL